MDSTADFKQLEITGSSDLKVSGVMGIPQWWPTGKRIGVVLAHDASETMDQRVVKDLCGGLAERGYLTLRFNFPYAEKEKKRPDPLPLLERVYREAVGVMIRDAREAPARLVLGGFGLGGRIAAQAVAQGVKADGLLLLSYPLHPAGRPAQQRSTALFRLISPMLFLQGTRDATCRLDRLETVMRRIGAPTTLRVIDEVDHGLNLVRRSERSQEEVDAEILEATTDFLKDAIASG